MTDSKGHERPIRVGVVGPYPPPYGGIVRIIENNIKYWHPDVIESHWIPSYPPSKPQPIDGVNYHDLNKRPAKSWKGLGSYLHLLLRSPMTRPWVYGQFVNYNAALSALIAREGIDVLYAHGVWPAGASAVLQSRIHGIASVVVTYGEMWHVTPLHRRQRRVEPYVMEGNSWVVATSEHCLLGAANRGARRDRSSVIYAGIDLDRFHPGVGGGAFRAKYDISLGATVISVLGLALRRKLDTLLDALERLDPSEDIHCLIGGVGDDLAYVERRVSAMNGINVHLLGFVPEDELPEFYAATDILVVSPNTLVECMGQSMKEAMACGRAVVGANIGGVPEALRDGYNGLLYESDAPEDLRRALNQLCGDVNLRKKMGANGRLIAEEKFSAEKSATQTLDLFKAVVSEISDKLLAASGQGANA